MLELRRNSILWLTVFAVAAAVSATEAEAKEPKKKAAKQAADGTLQLWGIHWRKAYQAALKNASARKPTYPVCHLRVLGDLAGLM